MCPSGRAFLTISMSQINHILVDICHYLPKAALQGSKCANMKKVLCNDRLCMQKR